MLSGQAVIAGTLWNDLDFDGVRDAGEPILPGRMVFLDADNNGEFDAGELSETTGATGEYAFTGLAAGTYIVRQVLPTDWLQSKRSIESAAGALVGLSGYRDLVLDSTRGLLYATTDHGTIERIDLATKSKLTPFSVGTNLLGADITPDGRYLYVAESQTSSTQGFVHKVDLATGGSTSIAYTRAFGETGAYDIAIGANGRGLLTTQFGGSGWTPLRRIDTSTDTLTKVSGAHNEVRQSTEIERSADGTLFFLAEANISSGPIFTYDPILNTFEASAETETFVSGINVGLNKDGSLIAIQIGGASIMDDHFNAVENLRGVSGGFAFDPAKNLLYALDLSSSTNDAVVAIDTTTWREVLRFQTGENIGNGGTFGTDTIRVSADGRSLVLGTPSGVRIFDLAVLTGGYDITVGDATVAAGIDFGSFADVSPEVRIGDVSVTEGNTGSKQVLVTVSLSTPSYQNVKLNYVLNDGSATASGLDYVASAGSLVFAPGETTKTIAVAVRGDTNDELDERFFVDVLSAEHATIIDGRAEVVIANDDTSTRAKLSGMLWSDGNSNGQQDTGEGPLAGWTVYLDENNNGQRDAWELSEITGADGRYTFVDLPAGDYTVSQIVPESWLQTTHVGLTGVAGQTFLLPRGTTSNPLYQSRDLVFDETRNQLLVTTAEGTVERIDLTDMRLLDSWKVGTSLFGADITTDGRSLYVAEGARETTQGYVRKINLDDGTSSTIAYNLVSLESGAFDIAIGSDGVALVTTQFAGSGWTPLRYLDTRTDQLSNVTGFSQVRQNTELYASADRTHVFMLESNISSGPIHVYDATTHTFPAHATTNTFVTGYAAATNRDGTLYALGRNGITIYNAALQVVMTKSFSNATHALVFDPHRDLLYRAGQTEISILDTNTWEELVRIPIGETLDSGKFPMSVSADGQTLFLGTSAGMRVYRLISNAQRVTLAAGVTVANADFGNRPLADNQPPTAADDDFDVTEDGFLIQDVLTNDLDPDGDSLTIIAVNGEPAQVGQQFELPAGGFVTVAADGSLTFNSAGAFDELAEGETQVVSFSYDVSDEFGAVSTATVNITIHGVNDPPSAVDDNFTVNESATVSGSLLENDDDIDGSGLTVVEVNDEATALGQTIALASGALLTVNADGTFNYDPNGAYVRLRHGDRAEDTFTYTISDRFGGRATGTVTITVRGEGGADDLIGYFNGEWVVGVSNGSSFNSTPWANWSDIAPNTVQHGDVNGDGLMDVVGFKDGAWWVGVSNGNSFVTSRWDSWSSRVWKDVTQIAVGDVDGDGDDDVLGSYRGSWWVGLSDGASFTPQRWAGWSDKPWQNVSLVDLDADGDDDLLANFNGAWWASLSTGSGFETATRWGAWKNLVWEAVGTFDANGDGRTDIYGFVSSDVLTGGRWYVGISDGSSFTFSLRSVWKDADWSDAIAGDFDGDGRDDLAARLNGAWWVNLSTPTGEAGTTSHWAAWKDVDWQNVTVGDFDGDGRDDIAARYKFGWWVARSTGTGFETALWDTWRNVDWTAVAAVEASNPPVSAPTASLKSAQSASEYDALASLWSSAEDDEFAAALLAV